MVFSDPIFLFGFLPFVFILYHLTRRRAGGAAAIAVLIAASCVFYAYWSIIFLCLLLAQIAVNYQFARVLERSERRDILLLAVVLNLALLGYFKYRNFFLENVEAAFDVHFVLTRLVVPLGISFHTFQQIALLADVQDGEAKTPPFWDYVFFVIFFPQLIAGPIVLHREMGEQVRQTRENAGLRLSMAGTGLFLLVYGLWKKVVLADIIAPHIDLAFTPGLLLRLPEAWLAAVGYALQLYMDFSGYSDMAVGLGLLFGFRLPNNFLVPYRATSMIDYWKRWHITMTRFFTMYAYVPVSLMMTRYARRRRMGRAANFVLSLFIPTMVTFFLSGLWHGAGWTFVMFGLVNGVGIAINHFWKDFKLPRLPMLVGWALTAACILVTLVYFRSVSLSQANYILERMATPQRLAAPPWLVSFVHGMPLPEAPYEWLRDANEAAATLGAVAVLGVLALLLPALSARPEAIKPSWTNAFALAGMGILVLGLINQPRTFLYFAF
jgi:D-alanyl-lipoteichoic acid acyltransferase DltB (MBOAT superfamily)